MTNLVLSASSKIPRLYEKMQTAIAACHSFDEVKAIADQAAAIAAYHKQIKDDVAMRQFLDIKMRAWRRLGEIFRAFVTTGLRDVSRLVSARSERQSMTGLSTE